MLDGARSTRHALALGLGLCVAFTLGGFWWFGLAMAGYAGAPAALGLSLLVPAAPLLEPQLLTFAVARRLLRSSGAARWHTMVGGAAVYVGTEWATPSCSPTPSGGTLPSALMRQGADVAGLAGLTVLGVARNECALAALRAGPFAVP